MHMYTDSTLYIIHTDICTLVPLISFFIILLIAAVLYIILITTTSSTNDHDVRMPTTLPCKSEKVLVNGYPVLIDEEGFDLSASLSVTLFYDNVTYNYCPAFAAKLSCRDVTTEIKSNTTCNKS